MLHGAKNAAGDREHSGKFCGSICQRPVQHDAAFPHPVFQIVKSKIIIGTVGTAHGCGFGLFGNAGTEEHHGGAGTLLADQSGNRPQRRHNGSHKRNSFGHIFLNVQVDGRAASGDHRAFPVLVPQQALVFPFDQISALGGLKHMGKAQLLHSAGKQFPITAVEIGCKRRRNGGNHFFALGQQLTHFAQTADVLFGILRTNDRAAPAQNTIFLNNLRLLIHNSNSLYRTVPNAFITVFTVGFFKLQDTHKETFLWSASL